MLSVEGKDHMGIRCGCKSNNVKNSFLLTDSIEKMLCNIVFLQDHPHKFDMTEYFKQNIQNLLFVLLVNNKQWNDRVEL